jgi:hypothetical protein
MSAKIGWLCGCRHLGCDCGLLDKEQPLFFVPPLSGCSARMHIMTNHVSEKPVH